jgi:dolichol-phosphate mannosyltransferase
VHRGEPSSSQPNTSLVSIIIPTYNESENIMNLIHCIRKYTEDLFPSEVIIVDDNSPDKTGRIVKEYADNLHNQNIYQQQYSVKGQQHRQHSFPVRVICRQSKEGLVPALLDGVKNSIGNYVVILDADFSHPPNVIVDMVNELRKSQYDIVSASRYLKGGQIIGWPLRRRAVSKSATLLARTILGLNHITDPMSGFFACKRDIVSDIMFKTCGFKLLLEILVKADNAKVKEIPYSFIDRRAGSSKLDSNVIVHFVKALLHLYVFKISKPFGDKRKKQTKLEN